VDENPHKQLKLHKNKRRKVKIKLLMRETKTTNKNIIKTKIK